jgi:hypothetical protein
VTEHDDAAAAAPDDTTDPAADAPAPATEPTGVPAADAARDRLGAVDDAPLDQHVDVYEDVHRRLQEGLADLDES